MATPKTRAFRVAKPWLPFRFVHGQHEPMDNIRGQGKRAEQEAYVADSFIRRKRGPARIGPCTSDCHIPFVSRLINSQPVRPALSCSFAIAFNLPSDQSHDQALKQLRDNWTISHFNVIRFSTEFGFSKHSMKCEHLVQIVNRKRITHWVSRSSCRAVHLESSLGE